MQDHLLKQCVYTIIEKSRFLDACGDDGPSEPISEGKRWKKGLELLNEARSADKDLPIVFADAADCSKLIGWAILDSILVDDKGTTFRIRQRRSLRRHSPQDLVLVSTGKKIAQGFIRPYAICRTPKFLKDSIEAELALEIFGLEGEIRTRMVKHYQRERKLRRGKISESLKQNKGLLRCEVPGCGFGFFKVYGDIGKEYAHVHHRTMLSERETPMETRLSDLAIVCANCHAMIHRGGECRALEALILQR